MKVITPLEDRDIDFYGVSVSKTLFIYMQVKTNIPVGFKILNYAINSSEFAKKNLADEVSGNILHIVISKAEENGGNPDGFSQNAEVEVELSVKMNLTPDLRRLLVIVGTYPLIAMSFSHAAREVYNQKIAELAKYASPDAEGFETAFQEFKAARFVKDFAAENRNVLPDFDVARRNGTDLRLVGQSVAAALDKRLSK